MIKYFVVFLLSFFSLKGLADVITTTSDARFTIGSNRGSLLFGFPHEVSTSHFVLKVGARYASNKPNLAKTTYIQGLLNVHGSSGKGSKSSVAVFDFEGVQLVQRITPLDKKLKAVSPGLYGQFYEVSYEIINKVKRTKAVGLNLLLDTSIGESGKEFIDLGDKSRIGYTAKYSKDNVPKKVSLIENSNDKKNRINALIFFPKKESVFPSEVYVGDWGHLNKALWGAIIPKNKKYKDPSLLVKWGQVKLSAKGKTVFKTQLGMYQKDTELILKHHNPNYYENVHFRMTKDSIYRGESVSILWQTSNPMKAKVSFQGKTVGNTGNIKLKPNITTTYTLDFRYKGKLLSKMSKTLKVKEKEIQVVKKPKKTYIKTDGRFSFANSDGEVLFGYPVPYSTSHFILNVNGLYATNMPGLADSVYYIKGKLSERMTADSVKISTVEYFFNDIIVKQILVPVGSDYSYNKEARFYRIEYQFKNIDLDPRKVGITLLLDTQSGEKDHCVFKHGNHTLDENRILSRSEIPEQISIYNLDNKSLNGKLITHYPPDELVLGHWEYLKSVIWDKTIKARKYSDDCAVVMRWKPRKILANHQWNLDVYYGKPADKKLKFKYSDFNKGKNQKVLFGSGQSSVSSTFTDSLSQFINRNTSKYYFIESYCDSKGSEEVNFKLSRKRAHSVEKKLISLGIPAENIIIKCNGNFFSSKDDKNDHKEDRKVVVSVLYSQNNLHKPK